jgi:hypothetical protein
MSTQLSLRGVIKLALVAAAVSTLAAGATTARASGKAIRGATITASQFAHQADLICASAYKQQAALGSPLVNADDVTRTHLARAAAYLDRIAEISTTEAAGIARLAATPIGMTARAAVLAAFRTILADERNAAGAAHRGDLAAFRAAFARFIVHGEPTGPDYRAFIAAATRFEQAFPFKVCGKGTNVYP